MIKFIVLAVLGLSSFAQAGLSDKDRGGANGVNGQLFDFYENQGTESMDIASLPVFKNTVRPVLIEFDKTHPGFYLYVTESLKSKKWYLEDKDLSSEGCLNGSMVEVQRSILACQSQYEVRINKAWMQSKLQTDEKQVAGMIIHEFLVAKMLANPEQIKEESVRHINRHLFAQTLTTEILAERGFPTFKAAKDIKIGDTDILTTDRPDINERDAEFIGCNIEFGFKRIDAKTEVAAALIPVSTQILNKLDRLHARASDVSLPTNLRKILFAIESESRELIQRYPNDLYNDDYKVACRVINENSVYKALVAREKEWYKKNSGIRY